VVLVLAVVGSVVASDADADVDADIPTRKPRSGAALTKAKTLPTFGGQRVVEVPKGDPRARDPLGTRGDRHHREHVEHAMSTRGDRHHREHLEHAREMERQHPERHDMQRPVTILQAAAPAANAGACLAHYNGAAVAAKAKTYQQNYKSRGVKYSQPEREFGINAKFSDCSSFVTSILADTGFDCLFAGGRYTAYMNKQIRLRGNYKQTAVAGDVVMWGSHTGLIVENCGGGRYTMVAMGLHGAGLAKCQTVRSLKAWGSGGWLGFWTPRP